MKSETGWMDASSRDPNELSKFPFKRDLGRLNMEAHARVRDGFVEFLIFNLDGEEFAAGVVFHDGRSKWCFDPPCELRKTNREGLVEVDEILASCWDWAQELPTKL